MFNLFLSIPFLSFIMLSAFFALFLFRHLFIKRKRSIVLYHGFLSLFLLVTIGGGGVQNDGYKLLEQFTKLEKNNQLGEAKKNLQKYDSMLAIDLNQFKNTEEFKEYLKEMDRSVDICESISIAWIFVLLADIAYFFILL